MPTKVRAKHILVKTEAEANEILYDVKHGKDFAAVAMEKSMCPSKKQGGDLGWFSRGMMVKEFENASFTTAPGEYAKVRTQFGWHVIQVIEAK